MTEKNRKNISFCGEIVYSQDVVGAESVHSDICHNHGDDDYEFTEENRQFFHDCLDEWLSKSNGTGVFWVGDYKYFTNWGES